MKTARAAVFVAFVCFPLLLSAQVRFSEIMYDMVCERLDQCPDLPSSEEISLKVHPRALSRLRGERNDNMKKLNLRYPNHRFRILTDEGVSMDEIEIF